MTYYKVKSQYDQQRKFPNDWDFLIANELYTEKERRKLTEISDEAFEQIDIPKNQTFWCFGARFQIGRN